MKIEIYFIEPHNNYEMTDPTKQFTWDEDPLVFIFKDEVKGRVKMHIHKLDLKDWVRIDSSYIDQVTLRNKLTTEKRELVFKSTDWDSTRLAKQEFLDMLIPHLTSRFPDKFQAIFQPNTQDIIGIRNLVFNEDFFLADDDPLLIASHLTQEDWLIMEYSAEHNQYILTAANLCFPIGWSLQQKFLLPMSRIHEPVKEFETHLRENVASVFEDLDPERPLWRANWFISNSFAGPLDIHNPATEQVLASEENHVSVFGPHTGREIVVRAEYQTLRRLPKSNAILFGIRTYQRYLEEFSHLPPENARALAQAIRDIEGRDTEIYKGVPYWRDAILQYLDQIYLSKL